MPLAKSEMNDPVFRTNEKVTYSVELSHHEGHLLLLALLFVFRRRVLLCTPEVGNDLLELVELVLGILVLLSKDVNGDDTLFVVVVETLQLQAKLVELCRHRLVFLRTGSINTQLGPHVEVGQPWTKKPLAL